MVKGRYVGRIIIEFEYDPAESASYVPFHRAHEIVVDGVLNDVIQEIVQNEINDVATVKVSQILGELFEVKEGKDDEQG